MRAHLSCFRPSKLDHDCARSYKMLALRHLTISDEFQENEPQSREYFSDMQMMDPFMFVSAYRQKLRPESDGSNLHERAQRQFPHDSGPEQSQNGLENDPKQTLSFICLSGYYREDIINNNFVYRDIIGNSRKNGKLRHKCSKLTK